MDTTGGLGAVGVVVRLDGADGADGADPVQMTGTVALDLAAGITHRGPLTDASGVTVDVDLVIVDMEPCEEPGNRGLAQEARPR